MLFVAAPTSPPNVTSFDFVNSTSMKASWLPPRKEELHGVVRNYGIYLAKGSCSARGIYTTQITRTTTTKENVNTEMNRFPQLTSLSSVSCNWKRFTVDGSFNSYVFDNLNKFTTYSVYVVCRTVGDSGNSEIRINSTDEDSKYLLPLMFFNFVVYFT